MRGIKYLEPLELTLEREEGDEIVTKPIRYFNSIVQTIISLEEIEVWLRASQQIILNRVSKRGIHRLFGQLMVITLILRNTSR